METELGKRISIIGMGGKTTLARAVASEKGLSHIELDALYWKPNWGESTPQELKDKVTAAMETAPDGWVSDGSYWSAMGDHLLRNVDMVISIDLPWRVGFWRMLKRSVQRAWTKDKICGDNVESWRKMFSRDALWVFWITNRKGIIHRNKRLATFLPAGVPVIHLNSASELDRFYEIHGLTRPV